MNDKSFNKFLIVSILITLGLIISVHFLPDKRLQLLPDPSARLYLSTDTLPNGKPSSEWTNSDHTAWKCFTIGTDDYRYLCSFTLDTSRSAIEGIDLSQYNFLNIRIKYQGGANKLRFATRNFNPQYSTPQDNNSTKFHSVQVHTKDLQQELHLSLKSLTVADWWLGAYNIPLSQIAPEMDNTMSITVDFGEPVEAGEHQFEIEKIELQGQWLAPEHWYLAILGLWLCGILIFSVKRLIELSAQAKHDTQVINKLNKSNEQLQEETNRFRRLSTVDPLTQLYNRFGIDQVMSNLTNSEKADKQKTDSGSYALLLADIDHFKRINDQRGHDVGDQVLQHIAGIIQTHLRTGDYVGRWGGEEFIIIMPNTSKRTAMAMADMIRDAIYNTPCALEKPLTISASFGVGVKMANEDFASCFKRVDTALYKAKIQGRNCCVEAEETL